MPRMRILNRIELTEFDTPPVLNSAERKRFFDLPSDLLQQTKQFRNKTDRVAFILTCGYFTATKKFFRVQDYHQSDIAYVSEQFDLLPEEVLLDEIPETNRRRHRKQILTSYQFKPFDKIF